MACQETVPALELRQRSSVPAVASVGLGRLLVLVLLTVWVAGYLLSDTVLPGLQHLSVFGNISADIAFAIAGIALVLRGQPGERGWLLIGLGALCWAAGDVYWSLKLASLSSPPVPSWADAGYLSYCPLAFLGIFVLVRNRASGTSRTLIIDAAAAALATGALSAAIVFGPVLASVSGSALAVATNLAYPFADLLLLGLIVAATALADWRPNRSLMLLGAGVISFWIADSLYLINDAAGTYSQHAWYNPLWYLSPVLMAWSAYLPAKPSRFRRRTATSRGIAMLVVFAAVALGILVFSSIHALDPLPIVLAVMSMLVIMGRLVLTWSENVRLLRDSQLEAVTDSLTGLRNRRALASDLEEAMATATRTSPVLLALFDLDGFKHYNDSFGHPAGDALLARLGGRLAARLGDRGIAYRMGGDEFCALIRPGRGITVGDLSEALHERGEGFVVGCSYGVVNLPEEAAEATTALRLADERMYAQKQSGRLSASSQSREVLLRALAERNPELGAHLRDVAGLAASTAHSLGLPPEEVEQVRQAAELHDVGKVAIPDAILNKPAKLEPEEWDFIRRHTIIGERIISAAPALSRIGTLVRSSHENWDGTGYPDRLTGEEIPLGSRIVAVCDAFDAMTTDRPYRDAMPRHEALGELRRCAGQQFDPRVVEAFAEVVQRTPLAVA
jgi:two-component system cell cycle response regulator